MNIIFITQWLLGDYSDILHCSDLFARRQKLCYPESRFKQKRVKYWTVNIWRHFLITSQLRYVPFLRDAAHFMTTFFEKEFLH